MGEWLMKNAEHNKLWFISFYTSMIKILIHIHVCVFMLFIIKNIQYKAHN